jgi:hypothetical protein
MAVNVDSDVVEAEKIVGFSISTMFYTVCREVIITSAVEFQSGYVFNDLSDGSSPDCFHNILAFHADEDVPGVWTFVCVEQEV